MFDVCQWLVRYVNVEYVHRLTAERRMDECTTITFFIKVYFIFFYILQQLIE